MDLPSGRTGGVDAAAIDALTALIAVVQSAKDNGASLVGGTLHISDPVRGDVIFPIAVSSVAESGTIFDTMISVLTARKTALTAALTAL